MLPEELDAHIHQLRGIQSAAAQMGITGGVGGDALEGIEVLKTGGVGAGGDLVGVAGVPGDGGVQIPELAVPGHEGLTGAALLAGTAVEDHGAGELAVLDQLFHGNRRRQRACAQKIVAAAVAVAAGDQGVLFHFAGLLGQGGEGIVLGQNADPGGAGAIGGHKGRGDIGSLLPDFEAFFPEEIQIAFHGLVLIQAQLRKFPDPVGNGNEVRRPALDIGVDLVFHGYHSTLDKNSFRRGCLG